MQTKTKSPKQPKITAELPVIASHGMKRLVRETRGGKLIYWVALPSFGGSESALTFFDETSKGMREFFENEIKDRFSTLMWRLEA